MSKPVITIIGLGVVGTSIGLALQRQAGNFEIVGHDKDPEQTQAARKLGAVQRTAWNLYNACDGADMIVLSVPLSEMRELLGHLRDELKPETLVFAAVEVLQPALALAQELLPAQARFAVGHPILTGVGGSLTARADLFDEVTFCLAAGVETKPDAMQLASDLVERVGATPFFVDPLEHDGLIAGVEQLPQLLAALLVQINANASSWREGKRLAGRQFAQSTELVDNAPQLADAWLSNRENLLQRIDQLQQAISAWRTQIASEAPTDAAHPLLAAVEEVITARLQWEGQAMLKHWDDTPQTPRVETRGMMQQMFFGGLMGRRDRSKEKTDK